MNQTTANRATAATLGGALTVLLVWVLDLAAGIQPPAEVVVAMTTVVGFFVAIAYRMFPGFSAKDDIKDLKTPWWVVCLLVPLMLLGCSSQHRAPETVYESLLVGNAYGEQVTHTVNDLRRAQVITSAQHELALDRLQDALDASRAARVAYEASRWGEAQTGLDRTESALRAVAVLLQPFMPEDPGNQAFITRYAGGNP